MTPEQEQLLIQAIIRLEQGQEEFRHGQEELRRVVMETRSDQEELRRGQEEQRRGQEELRRVVMETRADMAHFTEWVGVVTQVIEDLGASQARHDQALARHDQLLESLAAGQQQQQAILNELIRQRESSEE